MGWGRGGCRGVPPPPRHPYNSLPRSLSDSLGLRAGAQLSRCLSPTLPGGNLLPGRCGPCAGRSPGGRPSQVELPGAGESRARARAPRGGSRVQPRRLAGVATTGVACRALAAGAAGVSAAWQPTCPGMYLLHRSLPPSSPAAAGSFVPQLGGSRTERVWVVSLRMEGPGAARGPE